MIDQRSISPSWECYTDRGDFDLDHRSIKTDRRSINHLLTKHHWNPIQRGVSLTWHRCFQFHSWSEKRSSLSDCKWLPYEFSFWSHPLLRGREAVGTIERTSRQQTTECSAQADKLPCTDWAAVAALKANREEMHPEFLSTSFSSELQWQTAIPLW